jgi:hypothetical protein
MLRYLPYLLIFALWFYAFVDCVGTPERQVRGLPKPLWLMAVTLFGWIPVVPLAWLIAGRRRYRAPVGGATPSKWHGAYRHPVEEAPRQPWTPPDDNPEFLRSLGELNKRNRENRREGPPAPGGE